MKELAESLMKCKVEGNTLSLPPISDGVLPNYKEVRKALLDAGATYNKNKFIFPSDAQPFIDRLTSGQSVNIKKEFQFFATPSDVADWAVELAEINETDIVSEPSAGQGAIVDAIVKIHPKMKVDCFELMPENAAILKKNKSVVFIGEDFLQASELKKYDKIVANPPFNKNQDIDHIRKMYSLLKPKGRLVSIASKHWKLSSNKKETEFRNWLTEIGAEIHDIESGRFKKSGTMISCCIIVINK